MIIDTTINANNFEKTLERSILKIISIKEKNIVVGLIVLVIKKT